MKQRHRLGLLAAASLAAAPSALADVVQASATTMIIGRQDYRDGRLQTAVPLYQLLSLSASDIRNPVADGLEITLSTWGSLDVSENIRFWQNGARVATRLSGDVDVLYAKGDLFKRHLTLRLGRMLVPDGTARMVQLDGGQALVRLPLGLGVSGYFGQPVAPRFSSMRYELALGNTRGDWAYGGRAFWFYPGLLEVGASVALANDKGDPSRRDLGADFRITPHARFTVTGNGFYSLYEGRLGEAAVAATYAAPRRVQVTVDYRHVEPDLYLPRTSILAVFSAERRDDIGGSIHWDPLATLGIDADYHVLLAGTEGAGGSRVGHRAGGKGVFHPVSLDAAVGAELRLLRLPTADDQPSNGYFLARLFASKTWRTLSATADLYGYFFEQRVNDEKASLGATLTGAWEFARGWQVLLSGNAGATPYLARELGVMAKLSYNQTYVVREVR